MKVMAQKKPKEPQVERFKEAARVLGCDEDEAAFEAKLKKIASALPPKKQAKKPKKRAQALPHIWKPAAPFSR